jgi:glycine/D-amino acid oxidase-like deaminating enzyme
MSRFRCLDELRHGFDWLGTSRIQIVQDGEYLGACQDTAAARSVHDGVGKCSRPAVVPGIRTLESRHYLREPYGDVVEEEWFGWRPMPPDGLPVIDRSPSAANVLIAAGHNMLGVSMAPATGKLVAELLAGVAAHIDPAPYSAARFHGWR